MGSKTKANAMKKKRNRIAALTLTGMLLASSAAAQDVYRNLAFGVVVPVPAGYALCSNEEATDHGAIFVRGTAEICESGTYVGNRIGVSAWHSQAGDIDDLPPIRRAIAADKCRGAPDRKILIFEPAKRSVAGLPSFFCAMEIVHPNSGRREYFATLIFFRGRAQRPARPYPIYEYTLTVADQPDKSADAERLLFETARHLRLLPID